MRYVGDTIVGGQSAQVLRRSLTTTSNTGVAGPPSPLPTIITRTVGTDVSFWHNGQFVPLYQFGAQPGATWTTYATTPYTVCAQSPVQVTVDSVGTQGVGGRAVRWQAVHTSGTYSWQSRIYEGIGSLAGLQPRGGNCGGTDPDIITGMLRYRATGQPTLRTGGAVLTVLAAAEAKAQPAGFEVYPVPAAGRLTLRVPAAFTAATLTIADLTGRCLSVQATPADNQLNVSSLPPGVYIITLKNAGQNSLSRRVVIQ